MPPVSPLSKIWGRLPRQLNGAGAYTYLLTYLLSWSKSQSAFFRAEDSRSRRYNSAIEDCSFTASDTVLLGLQHAVQTVHPASSKPATSCPAFSVDPLK